MQQEIPVVAVNRFPSDEVPAREPASSPLRSLPQVDLCRRGEIRAEKFLDAATEVFAEKGYQHARLSEIVARAGGSLATLYRIYGDKEGLAHAILQRRLESHLDAMRDIDLTLPPEQALPQLGRRMALLMARPESQVIYRIVIGDGQSFPALRDWFFENVVEMFRATVAAYLQQQVDAGRLRMASTRDAACLLSTMLFGDIATRLASGVSELPDPAQLQANAQAAVDLFLQGTLPR